MHNLRNLKTADFISLGLRKEAWGWYSNLAPKVLVSVNVLLGHSAAFVLSISNICLKVAGEHVQHFICVCQLYLLAVAECRHIPRVFLQLLKGW